MDINSLTIGQVSKAIELGVDTIRFYERSGLLGTIERNGSGYRIYKPSIIKRLGFIKQSRTLGFSLNEIGNLLDLMHSNRSALSTELSEHLQQRKEEIRTEIRGLVRNMELLESFLCNACTEQKSDCERCSRIGEIIGANSL